MRRDHRADIAPVEHGAAGLVGEIHLPLEQRLAHRGMHRRAAGEAARTFIAKRGIVEQRIRKIAGGEGVRGLVGIAMIKLRLIAHGAIEQPGVEHGEAEMLGKRLGDGAFARSGGAVDRDDHRIRPSGKWIFPASAETSKKPTPCLAASRVTAEKAFSPTDQLNAQ